MEDKNKEIREDENLNSEEQATTDGENNSKVYTHEEVEAMRKEMTSNSEKGVQKVISEKKNYEKALKESGNIAQDPKRLVELYEDNPSVAEIILAEFYDGESIDEYKERIDYQEDYSDPKVMQSKIDKAANKIYQNKLVEEKKEKFIEKLEMTDEEKKSFEEAFDELRQLKSFSSKDLTKQFEKAYRLSNDNESSLKKLKNQEMIGKTLATSEGKGSDISKSKKLSKSEQEVAEFMEKFKI